MLKTMWYVGWMSGDDLSTSPGDLSTIRTGRGAVRTGGKLWGHVGSRAKGAERRAGSLACKHFLTQCSCGKVFHIPI